VGVVGKAKLKDLARTMGDKYSFLSEAGLRFTNSAKAVRVK